MKIALAVVLLAASALAQNQDQDKDKNKDKPNLTTSMSACGPMNMHFDLSSGGQTPTAQPEPDKALVYFVEDVPKTYKITGDPTMLLALDGSWIGATKSGSYISFIAEPGDHHMCVSWRSHDGYLAFARLHAEPGKTYFYRVQMLEINSSLPLIHLEPVDPDEGQYLVASSSLSFWHVKK